jgi:lysophospholipase L1-like esterase
MKAILAACAALAAKLNMRTLASASQEPASSPATRSTQPQAVKPALPLKIGNGVFRPDIRADTLFLTVPDVVGSYTIPYIQSSRNLPVAADFSGTKLAQVSLTLSGPSGKVGEQALTVSQPRASFSNLPPGEYELSAVGFDGEGNELERMKVGRIGVGLIGAAIGDSLTEGYFSPGWMMPQGADLSAGDFPAEVVSKDRRNFPQYAPTTHTHKPDINTFASWMPRLNDLLSASLGKPVFIANEGWGGYTAGNYLKLMQTDENWQRRMALLAPTMWLIHLGVNDERAAAPAEDFERNLSAIVEMLISRYFASPKDIFIARPSFDYAPKAKEQLQGYCERIEKIIARFGLSRGPDFFDAFSRGRQYWYGKDPVHPTAQRMSDMGDMWHEEIIKAMGKGNPATMKS